MRRRQAIRKLLAAMLCAALIISDLHIFAETKVFAAEPETVVTEDGAEEPESLDLENNDVSDGDSDAAVSAENMSSENSEENLQEENHAVGQEIEVYPQYSENSSSIVFQDGDIAHGTYEDITWVIDAYGKLTVSGTGEFSEEAYFERAPWYIYGKKIKSAEVNVSGMTNASYMFCECYNMTSIDLSGFDTSSLTNMDSMFRECSGLKSIDVSGLDTSKVTDMDWMFGDCSGLKSINMSGWDTSNVTYMNSMFRGCSDLTSIDVSGLDTSNVKNMEAMFSGCSGLASIDVSSFDTDNVRSMSSMFSGCSGLTSIDVRGLDTSKVTDMSDMFRGCSGLTSFDVRSLDTSNVTNMSGMFRGCSGLTSIDISGWDTSKVTNMSSMFIVCSGLTSIDVSVLDTSKVTNMSSMFSGCSGLTSLDVRDLDTSNVTDMRGMFWGCSGLTSIDVSGFDTSKVTNMSSMFWECSGLTSIDVNVLDTSNVTDMGSMFWGCSGLTSIDVSGLDTSKVKYLSSMFRYCSGLTSIDVSGLDTGNVTSMSGMFCGCSGLENIDVSGFDTSKVMYMYSMFEDCSGLTSIDVSGFDTSNVTDMSSMFRGCSGLENIDVSGFDMGNVTSVSYMFYNCSGIKMIKTFPKLSIDVGLPVAMRDESGKVYEYFPTGLTEGISLHWINSGSESGVTWEITEDGTLIIAGEKIVGAPNPTGKIWTRNAIKIKKVILSAKNIESTANWFEGCFNIADIDMSGFDTSKVTNMSWMFRGCSGLTSIDISGFDTSKVTDMSYMFSGCSGLTSIDMSGFNTSKVTDISWMFWGCSGLTSIDMSGWDTSKVTDMSSMFLRCSGLTSIEMGGWDTSKVTDMGSMFMRCSGLTSIDVSGFDTSNVTDMSDMFADCSGLTSIDMSGWDTSKVTDMSDMFADCSGLTSIEMSGFDTSKVTDMSYMFSGCSGLTSIDVRGFDTSNVTHMHNMFENCSGLTSIDVRGFDTSNVMYISAMFSGCSGLTSIDMRGWDTSNVTDMCDMFSGCSGLTNLDMSGFDTRNVTEMVYMFSGCSGIKTLKTFRNLSLEVELPLSRMYDADGNAYEYFPTGLTESITLYAEKGGNIGIDPWEDPSEEESSSESESASESGASGESESASESSASDESEPSSELSDSTGLQVAFSEGKSFTYTGSAIKPVIVVTNNGETLIEGIDYTVKYKNNTKAGTAKLTVTGKGSFAGKQETTFKIEQKSLNDDDIVANNITIAANSKASPVLLYNGMKLGAKDYTLSNPSKITEDTELVITGKGNYKDDVKIKVSVVEKAQLKKFKVEMKKENLTYNGTEQKLGFEVIDSKTKEPLKEDEYVAVYSEDATNAGTVKVTVTGQGMYVGSVTKSYKIAPLKAEDSNITVSGIKENYTFTSSGVTFNDETGRPSLQYKDTQNNINEKLILDRDYKISYSANKKAGTARYTINFIGNYKGTRPKNGTFTITPAVLDDATVNVYVPDKAYTGKANAYKSVPIVTDKNGSVLKKSDYTVGYYADKKCTQEIKGKENLIELAEGQNSATVYVKVTGKGNYAGASTDSDNAQQNAAAHGEYEVKRTTASVLDLSKAKITFKQNGAKAGKLEYTGKPITPDVEVSLKVKGVGTITLDSGQYDIQWTNNTNKGKAAVIITGNGQTAADSEYAFVGSKTATINITAKNIKNEQNLFRENTANFLKNLFATPKPALNTY